MLGMELGSLGDEAKIVRVRRVCEPRSKIKDEVVVEFSSPAVRDTMKGSGYKLEGKTASLRVEMPLVLAWISMYCRTCPTNLSLPTMT